jgi:hypothetical protein
MAPERVVDAVDESERELLLRWSPVTRASSRKLQTANASVQR